tara:strand:+ start:243 stop:2456 length:2214 start_codon:yes stop_codon:yes gene_type:complete
MFAQVAFPISSFQSFSYSIPSKLISKIKPGVCVAAPLNKKIQLGFIVSIKSNIDYKGKILSIQSISKTNFNIPKELWRTIEWMSYYYIAPLGNILKTAIPQSFLKVYKPQQTQYIKISSEGIKSINKINKNAKVQIQILKFLKNQQSLIKASKLLKISKSAYSVSKKLENKGLVSISLQTSDSDPFKKFKSSKISQIKLTKEQNEIYKKVIVYKKKFKVFLLHGVTGSGKTEIYLKLTKNEIEIGKTVLVLVPEIALTSTIAIKFNAIFGHKVALWHSKMTKSEKGHTWKQLIMGKYSIVIGARSAVYAPINNLGLIIVDEEHDSSYKQENPSPRYNARDLAILRAKNASAKVLLGSATPSLESYYNCINKKYLLLKLDKRYGKSTQPIIELIDMKKINYQATPYPNILSPELILRINQCLEKNEQIIILHNRRGHSLVYFCQDCGACIECKRCAVSMTYHRIKNYLRCHYCDYTTKIISDCKNCKSKNIKFSGFGIQQIEEILKITFPQSIVLRMDLDSVKNHGSHYKILNKFSEKKANILLGTQMIAKGLDFPDVTLVGIINADHGLYFPDFRSGEKIFQLIYQVCGRSGRREKQGRAIIQTYNSDDIYIKTATQMNTKLFYNISLSSRKELNYPPFSRLARLLLYSNRRHELEKMSQSIKIKLLKNKNFTILGPSYAPIEKIKNNWRIHIIIKSFSKKPMDLQHFILKYLGKNIFEKQTNKVRIKIDIDPINMM